MKLRYLLVALIFEAVVLAQCAGSPNCTVKAGGGGNYTTIQACATAQANGDTCTVFAGTYAESVTMSAGGVGAYKTIKANGSDVVTVTGSIATTSHDILSGITFNHTGVCISIGSSATDVFIGPNNSLTQCGSIDTVTGNSFIFIQGNTFAYAGCTPPTPGATCGRWINADPGGPELIENNDFSHYQLCIVIGGTTTADKVMVRNNVFHDQLETEAGSNGHSDSVFSEPSTAVTNILIEGNNQRNAVGPNAKGFLLQNDTGSCNGGCNRAIIRFNLLNRTGSGGITNDKSWPNVKLYNETHVDEGQESPFVSPSGGGDNMSSSGTGMSALNSLWYVGTQTTSAFNNWNPVFTNGSANVGHNLYWCTAGTSCTNVFNHTYQGSTFTADSGNLHSDPLIVSYVGVGSASNDFHLQNGSPAIAAGTNLTTVNGTQSGTSLVVTDAGYFTDGYGLANPNSTVQGDCISVTTVGNHVCITAVNYATNTLTLATSISATNGDPVWLYSKSDGVKVLTGSAPDMGAFPKATSTLAPPTNIQVIEKPGHLM